MELRHLEHFVAVASELQFTRAAQRVHVVQSTLSASIRTLERDLGVPLFTRTSRTVTLTEAGRVFLVEAHRVLNAAADARDAVTDVQNLAHATLSIGTGQYAGGLNIPELLARFHTAHPGVEIRLRQGGAGLLAEEVREGQLDLAIAALPHEVRDDLIATPIGTVPMLLACAPEHRLGQRRLVDLSTLQGESFVDFPAGWSARTAVDRSFEELDIERQVAFEVNDIIGLLNLVAHNLAIAIVPGGFASIPAAVSYARLRSPAPVLRYAAIRRKNERMSHAGRVFLAMALRAAHGRLPRTNVLA